MTEVEQKGEHKGPDETRWVKGSDVSHDGISSSSPLASCGDDPARVLPAPPIKAGPRDVM